MPIGPTETLEGAPLSADDVDAVAAWIASISWSGWVMVEVLDEDCVVPHRLALGPDGAPLWNLWRRLSDNQWILEDATEWAAGAALVLALPTLAAVRLEIESRSASRRARFCW